MSRGVVSDATIREELLQRAARLVPLLKQRAAETERLRQLPAQTIQDLIASGLIRGPVATNRTCCPRRG